MRIISGSSRGTRLATIESESTRPTSDRVKESMFTMIHFDLPQGRVLDLFAGSGQLGLEALSRGAAKATFVDKNADCTAIIMANAQKAKLFEDCVVCTADVATFISTCREQFDIILLDPPYGELTHSTLQVIFASDLLAPGGVIVVESGEGLNVTQEGYTVRRENRYGTSYVTIIDKN
ncbi:MAG: 16S rRNA (guanine(966)-N(2))-methyltransferase RsmD [Oscillospiraceae bacterium]|nr:16S rRNA (guanine(966)-N(2))-methyltransferase RsmD [Oscillospiraceae bacterium]